ncbi:hypothetical protein QZH41_000652 [Actinostola sp. cb2023]|nr:hypothetical protein QZH41_000652 [Actinostola sp. cb2023]
MKSFLESVWCTLRYTRPAPHMAVPFFIFPKSCIPICGVSPEGQDLQRPNIESKHVFLGQYGRPFEASYVHRALKSFASKTLILEHEVVKKFCATMLRKVCVTNTRDQSDTSKTNIATLMCHSLPTANRHYSLQNKLDQSSKGHDAMRALFRAPVKQATEVAADDIDSDVELGSTVASTNTVPPTPPRKVPPVGSTRRTWGKEDEKDITIRAVSIITCMVDGSRSTIESHIDRCPILTGIAQREGKERLFEKIKSMRKKYANEHL